MTDYFSYFRDVTVDLALTGVGRVKLREILDLRYEQDCEPHKQRVYDLFVDFIIILDFILRLDFLIFQMTLNFLKKMTVIQYNS